MMKEKHNTHEYTYSIASQNHQESVGLYISYFDIPLPVCIGGIRNSTTWKAWKDSISLKNRFHDDPN